MTQLEHVGDGSVADRNFQKLMGLLPDTGGQSLGIRMGQQNVSTVAAVSGTATVTHGLGKTPTCVLATDGADAGGITNATVSSVTDTQFTLAMRFTDGVSRTTTHGIYWMVVG